MDAWDWGWPAVEAIATCLAAVGAGFAAFFAYRLNSKQMTRLEALELERAERETRQLQFAQAEHDREEERHRREMRPSVEIEKVLGQGMTPHGLDQVEVRLVNRGGGAARDVRVEARARGTGEAGAGEDPLLGVAGDVTIEPHASVAMLLAMKQAEAGADVYYLVHNNRDPATGDPEAIYLEWPPPPPAIAFG